MLSKIDSLEIEALAKVPTEAPATRTRVQTLSAVMREDMSEERA
jgi:hypothetical protein